MFRRVIAWAFDRIVAPHVQIAFQSGYDLGVEHGRRIEHLATFPWPVAQKDPAQKDVN